MSHAPTAALDARHRLRFAKLLPRGPLDALVVTSLPSVLYPTNFTGSSAIVVLARDALHFITDFRYVTVLAEARAVLAIVRGSGAGQGGRCVRRDAHAELSARSAGGKVGFEGEHLTGQPTQWLSKTLASAGSSRLELACSAGIVERAAGQGRVRDVDAPRSGASLVRCGPCAARPKSGPASSGREVATAIGVHLHEAGFSKPAFDTIRRAAAPVLSAVPHARPGEAKVHRG